MNRSVLKVAGVMFALLASSMVGLARTAKIDAAKGEGNWGIDGAPFAAVSNVSGSMANVSEVYGGSIKNVAKDAISEITVTGGEHNKDGSVHVYDSTTLHAKLLPGETWEFQMRRYGDTRFEVLRISVDGHDLTQIKP